MKAPGTWTIEGLFAGRPAAFGLFEIVRQYIASLGPVKMEAAKTQVSFGVGSRFAWVWLPQMWVKKQREGSITLTFDLGRHVMHPRIKQAVEPRSGRWTHHVVIETEADFDGNVRDWLREAYCAAKDRASAKQKK